MYKMNKNIVQKKQKNNCFNSSLFFVFQCQAPGTRLWIWDFKSGSSTK